MDNFFNKKIFYTNLIVVKNKGKVNIRTSIFVSSRDILNSSIDSSTNKDTVIIIIINY